MHVTGLGGMSSRPCRIHSNMATSEELVRRQLGPRTYALEPGWTPVTHPMFCLLSKEDTWNPQEYVHNDALKKVLQGKMTMDACRADQHIG